MMDVFGKNTAVNLRVQWDKRLAVPENYKFEKTFAPVKNYKFADCNAELYLQANGPGTFQRVLMVFPEKLSAPAPAVVVPFYFPEAMIGWELDTGEILERYTGIAMMHHLAQRGFISISAEAYHLTYLDLDLDRLDFSRWKLSGEALKRDYTEWSGIGKLMADTRLLIDLLENDPRVDRENIGIAGHSLGGKMAFYTGCFDPRIKAVLTSDFGICWDQTNWHDIWYWGDEVEVLKAAGMEHWQLLEYAGGKPFALLAGHYDNGKSLEMISKVPYYTEEPEKLCFVNHATGHCPPEDALKKGYRFLEKHLKRS